jgi:hypothetical protein
MQSAACDADSDNLYFEECSQRLSEGRDMMLLKEAAWLDERPDSVVELHKIQQIARKHQREENQKKWVEVGHSAYIYSNSSGTQAAGP